MRIYPLYLFFFFLIYLNVAQTVQLEAPKIASKTSISAFTNQHRFAIYYVFGNETLNDVLKETMIRQLRKIGTVFLSDEDYKLSEYQKEDKYNPGGILLKINVNQIIDEDVKIKTNNKEFPVIKLKLQVVGGVEVLDNGNRVTGILWEDEKYISSIGEKKTLIKNAIQAMDSLINAFAYEYQKANPGSDKPQFFLFF